MAASLAINGLACLTLVAAWTASAVLAGDASAPPVRETVVVKRPTPPTPVVDAPPARPEEGSRRASPKDPATLTTRERVAFMRERCAALPCVDDVGEMPNVREVSLREIMAWKRKTDRCFKACDEQTASTSRDEPEVVIVEKRPERRRLGANTPVSELWSIVKGCTEQQSCARYIGRATGIEERLSESSFRMLLLNCAKRCEASESER